MFAIVEYSNHYNASNEIAIVPQNWLIKNDRKCYWPNKIGKIPFEDFVRKSTPHKKSWALFSVSKVHFKTCKYVQIAIVF